VRMPLGPAAAGRILDLARAGIKVFHLCTDLHGRERLENGGRPAHQGRSAGSARATGEGRYTDEVTLIVSGGIALAEHMAKAIICGADLVAVDTALLVAWDAGLPGTRGARALRAIRARLRSARPAPSTRRSGS